MESSNGTCGLTQLPIIEGEDVLCFILINNRYAESNNLGSGFSFADELYIPYTIPIEGKYNDYGRMYDIIDNNNTVYNQLFEHINDKSILEDIHAEIPDIYSIIKLISNRSVDDLSFMFIHKDLYHPIVEEMGQRPLNSENELNLRQSISKDIDDFVIAKAEMIPQRFELNIGLENNYFVHQFQRERKYYKLDNIALENKELIIDFMLFMFAFNISRKLWTPQSGAGSQANEYYIPHLIEKFVTQKYVEQHVIYKEECHDYNCQVHNVGKYL